ncbi:MAG: hypothetical protein FWE62_05625 [Firmicutes bacterium]|nr:hypothetical protein [Bacillota bacterium]
MAAKRRIWKLSAMLSALACFATIFLGGAVRFVSLGGAVQAADTALMIWDGTVAEAFAGGTGTKTDPYLISNGKELAYLAQLVNEAEGYNDTLYNNPSIHYVLTNNIYLNDTSNWTEWGGFANGEDAASAGIKSWTPIGVYTIWGDYTKAFWACFDGGNYTVHGVYIGSTCDLLCTGLFGSVQGGTVQNTGVAQSYIDVAVPNGNTGVIAGLVEGGRVTNCHNAGEIKNQGDASSVGGVAGRVSGTELAGCYNTGNVAGNGIAGGVAGSFEGWDRIINCYNTGDINGVSFVGGITGGVGSGNVMNCYNTGGVRGDSYVGGITGSIGGGTIANCYNMGIVYGESGDSVGNVAGGVHNASSVTNCYYHSAGIAVGGIGEVLFDDNTVANIYAFGPNGQFIIFSSIKTLLDTLNAWVSDNQTDPAAYFEWQQPDLVGFPVFIWADLETGGGTQDGDNDDDTKSCGNGGNIATAGFFIAALALAFKRKRT